MEVLAPRPERNMRIYLATLLFQKYVYFTDVGLRLDAIVPCMRIGGTGLMFMHVSWCCGFLSIT